MLCDVLVGHETAIKGYCKANGFSYDKLAGSVCSYNETHASILDSETSKAREQLGLRDNIPMEVALEIHIENGKLRFEQTDITHKYLGVEREVAPAPKPMRSIRPSIPARQKLAYA